LSNGGLISGAFAEQSAHTGGIDLSAKGDMHGYSNDDARIPISTNNFSLLCSSAESLGLKWAASPTSVLNATGKMLYASSANTLAAISPGAENTVLTMGGSSVPAWAAAAAGGGDFVKIAQTILASDGLSLKIADQSIELDPSNSPTYSQLYIVGNLLWDANPNRIITATINDGTGFDGCSQKNASGTITGAQYGDTSTIPISQALGRNMSCSFWMKIGIGYATTGNQTLIYNWWYTGNDDTQVMGGGRLRTTASSIFTDIDLISDENIEADSTLTLYGIKV